MGLKDNSNVVSVLLGVFFAAVAVAQIAYVILSGNTSIRIFLVGSSLGIFVVLGLTILRVVKNDSEVDETHTELSQLKAKNCPDYWTRKWDKCSGNYQCIPQFELPSGETIRMIPAETGGEMSLSEFNSQPSTKCTEIRDDAAAYPFTEMVNRCNAKDRKSS